MVRMVSVQEVPKRADRNPNTTFYLWTIKHDQVRERALPPSLLQKTQIRKYCSPNSVCWAATATGGVC